MALRSHRLRMKLKHILNDILPSCVNIVFTGLAFPCPAPVRAATFTEYSVNTVRLVSLTVELVVLTERLPAAGSELVRL